MTAMRKLILALVLFTSIYAANAQQPPSPEQTCEAALGFLNAVNSGNIKKGIGQIYQANTIGGMELRRYHSLQPFPGAQRTIIIDTNRINRARSVEVLLATETVKGHASKEFEKAFDFYVKLFDKCLVAQKYEADESQAGSLHTLVMTYRLELSAAGGGLFSTPDFLMAQVYIDTKKNPDGTSTLELGLAFKRI
jgi:hypothetical protein